MTVKTAPGSVNARQILTEFFHRLGALDELHLPVT